MITFNDNIQHTRQASVFEAICERRDDLLQPAVTWLDTGDERLNLVVRTLASLEECPEANSFFMTGRRPPHTVVCSRSHPSNLPLVVRYPDRPRCFYGASRAAYICRTLQEALAKSLHGVRLWISRTNIPMGRASALPAGSSHRILVFGTLSYGRASTPLTA